MDPENGPTFKILRERMDIPEHAKARSKEFARMKKTILDALEPGPASIPDISESTGLPPWQVTYYLMSLRKYGLVEETQEINESDYYLYSKKEKGR
jgi:predicted transcriptional regulator